MLEPEKIVERLELLSSMMDQYMEYLAYPKTGETWNRRLLERTTRSLREGGWSGFSDENWIDVMQGANNVFDIIRKTN